MKFSATLLLILSCSFHVHAQKFYWHQNTAMGNGSLGSSYHWSSRQDGQGSRPPGVSDDRFDGASLNTAWTFLDADGVAGAGAYSLQGGKLILSGSGLDLTRDKHFFVSVYRKDLKGNFDVTVRVDSQFKTHNWAKAGIIMANDMADFSKGGVALSAITPGSGAIFERSVHVAGNIDTTFYPGDVVLPLPVWLRMVRSGNTVTGYFRTDSLAEWSRIAPPQATLGLDPAVDSHIGLFVVSIDPLKSTAASFEDFRGGGEIADGNLDLSFAGTGANSDANASLAGNFSAGSLDFGGFSGSFSFGPHTLTAARNVRFVPTMAIDAGVGSLELAGSAGPDTLWPKPDDTLPAIRKTGAGRLVVKDARLTAASLRVEAGSFDLNDNGAVLAAFSSSGGSLGGLGADDSLMVTGDADFSGLAALDLPLGSVVIKSIGDNRVVRFNPGGKNFPRVILWTWATGTGDATVVAGPGALVAGNGLVFRNSAAPSGQDGILDFRAQAPSVTVAGDLAQALEGSGTNAHILWLGRGAWTVGGDVTLSLAGGGSADSSVFRFDKAAGAQTLSISGGKLFSVEHAASGTLRLGAALEAAHLRHSAGSLDFNGFDVAVTGDLRVENGGPQSLLNLAQRNLTVGGSASFTGGNGALLGMNPAGKWSIKATGPLSADSADIANSDASGGSEGIAAKGCVNGEGNLNWKFWTPSVPAAIIRQPADLTAKPGGKAAFSVDAQGSSPVEYAWRRLGDAKVLSSDSLLLLENVAASMDLSEYQCIVSNAFGRDTSRAALLLVRDCDSVFSIPTDIKVDEGGKVTLAAKAGCAAEVVWIPLSGPVPRILDPQVETLTFTAPRVQGDSVLVFQFGARFGTEWRKGNVSVTVAESVPEPAASLADEPAWNGTGRKVVRALLGNGAALENFPEYPLRYVWSVNPLLAETTMSGDSLVLANPAENGSIEVGVCVDNGAVPSCARTVVEVRLATISLLSRGQGAGPFSLSGSHFRWNRTGSVRVLDWRGRMLWEASGRPGIEAVMPSGAERALRAGVARLEFLSLERNSAAETR